MNAEQKVKDAEQMQKTHWCYWLPGMLKPAETPEGCEWLNARTCKWTEPRLAPNDWTSDAHRWPATKAEVAAWHWCQMFHAMGKNVSMEWQREYEVVSMGYAAACHTILMQNGKTCNVQPYDVDEDGTMGEMHPILRKRHVATWRPAVAGDEADCPLCRHTLSWDTGTLLHVLDGQDAPYIVEVGDSIRRWSRCEIMEVRND